MNLSERSTRRSFLYGAGIVGGGAVTASILSQTNTLEAASDALQAGIALYHDRIEAFNMVNAALPLLRTSEFATHSAVKEITLDTPNTFFKKQFLVFGDSLAAGFLESPRTSEPNSSPAIVITHEVNSHIKDANWREPVIKAQNWSAIDDTIKQIQEVKHTVIQQPIDVLISVGSNDARKFVRTSWGEIQAITAQPTKEALEHFVAQTKDQTNRYQEGFYAVLEEVTDIPAGIVYIAGPPNGALLEKFEDIDGEGRRVVIPVRGNWIHELFAAYLSSQLYIAWLTAITNFRRNNGPNPQVVLVDNYHTLNENHFTLMHPNEDGYETMADNVMRRCVVEFPNGRRMPLLQAIAA